jgi:hypothetical protein
VPTGLTGLFPRYRKPGGVDGCYRIAHGQRSLVLTLSRERWLWGLTDFSSIQTTMWRWRVLEGWLWGLTRPFPRYRKPGGVDGCYRIAHGQRSLALTLSRERVTMGFDQLFLDTENHVLLTDSESRSVWGGWRHVGA